MTAIVKDAEGRYHWPYELSLYRNPSILFLVWKVFLLACLGLIAFSAILSIIENGFSAEDILGTVRVMGTVALIMMVVSTIGYLVYALINGGSYCVHFTMDDKGIEHAQMPRQVKKAELIGALAVLAGIAAKRPSTAGAGMLAAARTTMTSDFADVKRVVAYPKRSLIKLDAPLSHNQVYADGEDFEFVLDHILARVPADAVVVRR